MAKWSETQGCHLRHADGASQREDLGVVIRGEGRTLRFSRAFERLQVPPFQCGDYFLVKTQGLWCTGIPSALAGTGTTPAGRIVTTKDFSNTLHPLAFHF